MGSRWPIQRKFLAWQIVDDLKSRRLLAGIARHPAFQIAAAINALSAMRVTATRNVNCKASAPSRALIMTIPWSVVTSCGMNVEGIGQVDPLQHAIGAVQFVHYVAPPSRRVSVASARIRRIRSARGTPASAVQWLSAASRSSDTREVTCTIIPPLIAPYRAGYAENSMTSA